MGSETIVGIIAVVTGLFTWSHQQKQKVTEARFESIKKRLEGTESKIEELPLKYVLKSDLNNELDDIRIWLRSINDKLDRLIMNKSNDKT